MSTDEAPWQLYRYHHGDGTRKDWAYRQLADGSTEIAWGRSERIAQRRIYPAHQAQTIEQRAWEKERKGYVPLGQAVLSGSVFEVISTQRASVRFNPPSSPRPSPMPDIDLSRIAPGQDNLWF